ncbi:hypothetical protein MTX25_26625 [Bradyrhizobium sp. ISRA432]|nr:MULTISPECIES: acyl-CoA dehydrogenase family protein [unclassified Bradyrhizobium]WGR69049.1 hypothetical protein MTX24_26945 [Bradyrhizobium sp. ISRA426]WGR81104.1 hypothetical protein MTX21_12060 [Bradyrhizobium sp. ISRA430]WGR84288.1 hypothetical protein MTX25_26625 [Bradyrhizobium sp. ISRA432]
MPDVKRRELADGMASGMAARVIDRTIQIHCAADVSQDTFLARGYVYARFIRIGGGPDQVHLAAVGNELIKRGGVMAG